MEIAQLLGMELLGTGHLDTPDLIDAGGGGDTMVYALLLNNTILGPNGNL